MSRKGRPTMPRGPTIPTGIRYCVMVDGDVSNNYCYFYQFLLSITTSTITITIIYDYCYLLFLVFLRLLYVLFFLDYFFVIMKQGHGAQRCLWPSC